MTARFHTTSQQPTALLGDSLKKVLQKSEKSLTKGAITAPTLPQPLDATEHLLQSIWRTELNCLVDMTTDLTPSLTADISIKIANALSAYGYQGLDPHFFSTYPFLYQQAHVLRQQHPHQAASLQLHHYEKKQPITVSSVSCDQYTAADIKRPTVIFFHPAAMSSAVYQRFADQLQGVDMMGIEPDFSDSLKNSAINRRVIESAAVDMDEAAIADSYRSLCERYMQLIERAVDKDSPLIFAGWSHGGLLALSVAALSEDRRQPVEVICYDSFISCDKNSSCFKLLFTDPLNPCYSKPLVDHLKLQPRAYQKKVIASFCHEEALWGKLFKPPKLSCKITLIDFMRSPSYLQDEIAQQYPQAESLSLNLEHGDFLQDKGMQLCLQALRHSSLAPFLRRPFVHVKEGRG